MAAPTQRPNFLLIWIGVLILVFGAGLRALVPEPVTRHVSELQPIPAPGPAPTETEGQNPLDPNLPEVPAPAPAQDQSQLVEGESSLPDFMRSAPGGESADAARSAILAGAAEPGRDPEVLPAEPSRLERLEPAPLGQGERPRPSRRESLVADASRGSDRLSERAPVLRISYPGSTFRLPETPLAPEQEELEPVVTEALVVQIAPETFRVLLVVEDPAPTPSSVARAERSRSEAAAEEPATETESQPASADREERMAALRAWLESRAGRGELTAERLEWLREQMRRSGMDRDPRLRKLLIADLDRRELARLLKQRL